MTLKNVNLAVAPSTKKDSIAWSTAARNLVAAHPHISGVSLAALAAALGHFYYKHSPVTVAMWAASGLIGGEVLSRILAHAKTIEDTAKAVNEALKAMKDAGDQIPTAMGMAGKVMADLDAMKEEIAGLRIANDKFREEQAAAHNLFGRHQAEEVARQADERAAAEFFRKTVMAAKAKAEAKAHVAAVETPVETPVVEPVVETAPAVEAVEAATPAVETVTTAKPVIRKKAKAKAA
jgi:hypothetical protein